MDTLAEQTGQPPNLNTFPLDPIRVVPVTVIAPTSGWAALRLHELWEYRDLLYFMTWRDLKARYRQMALGPLWIVLQPLINTLLYTVIFGMIAQLPSEGQPYALFTYVAMVPWAFFASAVAAASGSLLSSKDLISKVYFPRLVVPFSLLISAFVDFVISFAVLAIILLVYGAKPNWGVLLLPMYMVLAAATGLGTGFWFAGIIVKYRDFGQVAGYLVRAWMYATPVVYSITVIPAQWLTLYKLNPMTQVVEGFRWALLGTGQPPDWTLLVSIALVLPLFIGGLFYFKRAERNIVDVV